MNVYLRVRDLKQGSKRKPDQNHRLEYSPSLKLPGGKISRWRSLKLYIYLKPRNPQERQHNKEVKELAEQIRSDTERGCVEVDTARIRQGTCCLLISCGAM